MATFQFSSTLILLFLTLLFQITPSAATNRYEVVVKANQKIQEAIDAAKPYTTIYIEGTHREQLLITKDGIQLIGKPNSKLLPPTPYVDNKCTGIAANVSDADNNPTQVQTQAGICIIGDVVWGAFEFDHKKVATVNAPIKDVKITGIEVVGFSGLNIVVVGGQDTTVEKNRLIDGVKYGFLTLGSVNTKFSENRVQRVSFDAFYYIAICNDDKSDVKIWNNNALGYFIGLCIQTNRADVKGNHVTDTCFGAFVDPGVDGAQLRWNHISNTSSYCGTLEDPSSFGIIVLGAQNTLVRWNFIRGITASGAEGKLGVGIGVYDSGPPLRTLAASGNVIKDNYLKRNDYDVQIIASGAGNIAKDNECATGGYPATACFAPK